MELTVVSGKGGTGKTTIALALSELAKDVVKADCDVDAPNLYLFYEGKDIEEENFYGEKKAVINQDLCINCGKCEKACHFDAIKESKVDYFKCEGCGACTMVCTQKAVELVDKKSADIYITQTKKGIIARAQMEIGSEGSGKLITQIRKKAGEFSKNHTLTIIDGSPGIGCPVISSITGSDAVLIVAEPTQSGLEDLKRVVELCRHFGVFTFICINKYDLNEKISRLIEDFCLENDIYLLGKIPYDDKVLKSINELKSIVYYEESKANEAIRNMWDKLKNIYKI